MRISIYVPPDLFEAMQRRKDLNWSALAQEAFRKAMEVDRAGHDLVRWFKTHVGEPLLFGDD
jgi:post-segregation antitoxin (ccd killing protein)